MVPGAPPAGRFCNSSLRLNKNHFRPRRRAGRTREVVAPYPAHQHRVSESELRVSVCVRVTVECAEYRECDGSAVIGNRLEAVSTD